MGVTAKGAPLVCDRLCGGEVDPAMVAADGLYRGAADPLLPKRSLACEVLAHNQKGQPGPEEK